MKKFKDIMTLKEFPIEIKQFWKNKNCLLQGSNLLGELNLISLTLSNYNDLFQGVYTDKYLWEIIDLINKRGIQILDINIYHFIAIYKNKKWIYRDMACIDENKYIDEYEYIRQIKNYKN